ncbi:MAG: ATP-binding protein [Kiritimatiellaeota bacterium]|nr:ATP-binding protein [Kiritimatiellota bacterium]
MNSQNQQGNSAKPWLIDLFNRTPDMIIVLDSADIIRDTNAAFQTFCKRSASVLLGCKITEFIPAEKHIQWAHDLNKLVSGEWTSLDATLINAEKRAVPFHITHIAHSTHAGQSLAILHLQDASVYQNVERAMVAAQGQWERSFDAIADYMCLLDLSGHILRANQAMTKRFEPLYGNLVGCDYRKIFGIADAPAKGPTMPHAVEASPFVLPKIELPNLKGWFTVSSFPLKDEHEAITGVVLIVRDITDQHATAEALKKAEVNQHQTSKMEAIGRLAGGIAHDFNNMLTSVLGYSSLMLKMTKPDDPRHNDIHEIILAAERATALTRQLLDFSRNQAIETKNVSLNAIIQNIQEFLGRTLGEKIKLNIRLDPNLRNIKADVSRLEQVIINLVVNARDAMPSGGQLMIETVNRKLDQNFCTMHPSMAPGNYVELEVSDTGCGMPPNVLEHLFEPFFTTKAKGKGTGLGLTTTYGIVKQFGGHITVYSEISRGSTFKLYFPESQEANEAGSPAKQASVLLRGNETIMVVDDEANIVTMISQILTELGYHVISATSPRKALTLGDQHAQTIDMVLTDIIMPEINGPDLVRMLRKKRPTLKALYMSGYASNAAEQIGVLKLNSAFLQKPFSSETLSNSIRKVLDVPGK